MIKQITIKTDTEESKAEVLEKVHNQLKGNQDYIDCNIVLNDDNLGTDDHLVNLYIFEEATNVPEIKL